MRNVPATGNCAASGGIVCPGRPAWGAVGQGVRASEEAHPPPPRPRLQRKIMNRNQNDPWCRQSRRGFLRTTLVTALCGEGIVAAARAATIAGAANRRLLYVAVPGIRDYLERGGHGVLGFDIDRGHTLA